MMQTQAKTQSRLQRAKNRERTQLIQVDKKYALMSLTSQQKVSTLLQNELDYLLGKRQRQNMKRIKVQELQSIYQRQRMSRLTKMTDKISKSDRNRMQSLKQKQVKSKKNLEFVQQKIKKRTHDNQQEIEKMLQRRKEFNKHNSDSRASLRSNSSKLNKSRSFHNRTEHRISMDKSADNIDSRILEIENKIDQAKTNQQFYHQQISERAKGFSKNYEETEEKIRSQSRFNEAKCLQEYYKRATHIVECQQKSKSFYQNQSERKKKSLDQKFKKCNANLKILDRQRQSKYQTLKTKFERSFAPKTWKNQKDEVYLSYFLKNYKQIELQNSKRAGNILQKHLDISLKNKALREKKQKIFQTVKNKQI